MLCPAILVLRLSRPEIMEMAFRPGQDPGPNSIVHIDLGCFCQACLSLSAMSQIFSSVIPKGQVGYKKFG